MDCVCCSSLLWQTCSMSSSGLVSMNIDIALASMFCFWASCCCFLEAASRPSSPDELEDELLGGGEIRNDWWQVEKWVQIGGRFGEKKKDNSYIWWKIYKIKSRRDLPGAGGVLRFRGRRGRGRGGEAYLEECWDSEDEEDEEEEEECLRFLFFFLPIAS